MLQWLKAAFVLVLVAMTWVTVEASLDSNVLEGGARVWADPWGRATLFDAYFAFLTIFLWIAWRERTTLRRVSWLVALLLLGNFAIAAYFLWSIHRLGKGADWSGLFRPSGSE